MSTTEAVVIVFAMFFAVISIGIVSHHYLEISRLQSGFYSDNGPEEEQSTEE